MYRFNWWGGSIQPVEENPGDAVDSERGGYGNKADRKVYVRGRVSLVEGKPGYYKDLELLHLSEALCSTKCSSSACH
jgi:hypothetical protein